MEAASPINAPHPDDEAEDFFGTEGEGSDATRTAEAAAEEARIYREEHGEPVEQDHSIKAANLPSEAEVPEPLAQQERLRAIAEKDAAAAAAVEPEPTPPAASDGPTEPEAEPEVEAAKPAPRGSVDRTYVVFQKVPLTEKVLKHLLKLIEDGKAPEPRVAYFELHRPVARNDRTAIAETYRANRESLGAECELAAVSERSFKERKVAPRQVVRDDISIV